MTTMILVALGLLIVIEVISLWHNAIILSGNVLTQSERAERAERRIKEFQFAEKVMLRNRKFTGFAIWDGGITPLPEDWHKRVFGKEAGTEGGA